MLVVQMRRATLRGARNACRERPPCRSFFGADRNALLEAVLKETQAGARSGRLYLNSEYLFDGLSLRSMSWMLLM